MAGHTEHAFEMAIEHGLITRDRYQKHAPDTFDPATTLFPDDVIGFIRYSQPARWGELEAMLKDRTAENVLDSLVKELQSKGALGVLRHGFKCYGKALQLAFFRPNSGMNPQAAAQYAANRFAITRQVAFRSEVLKNPDQSKRKCVIDVTLSVNDRPARVGRLQTISGTSRWARSPVPLQRADARSFRRRS
jgi:type I restriction enzyme R subunit